MKYLLDTNICVHFLRGRKDVAAIIREVGIDNCYISEVTKAELIVGDKMARMKGAAQGRQNIYGFLSMMQVIPISNSLEFYASEAARLRMQGNMIEDFDLLIGCSAVANGMVLVSENVSHMSRISGIRLENWADGR